MNFDEMTARMRDGQGFIAALDQSGGSTPKALQSYGVEDSEWDGDEEMFAKIHEMRCRIVDSPSFSNGKVIGAILFEKTMEGCSKDGSPIPALLSRRGIVPFLKVDKGMHDTENGVQLMKEIPTLAKDCARAKELGVFGTKMRSVIHEADQKGVADNIRQQMDFGLEILDQGLVPILEPEVSLKSESRAQAEAQPALAFDESATEFDLPPLGLLSDPKAIQRHHLSDEALEENARMLENVLDDYGVKGEIVSVRPGPVVTMYELEPAPGLKASRVIGLADDIARSMSALSARVSTVPGRSVIGIELPNAKRETVYLRDLLASGEYDKPAHLLPLALGETIGGEPYVAGLARMPHLLIAGTTGSGKSVCINSIVASLLFRFSPEELRFVMIDPKVVELQIYNGLPHLAAPVVHDPKKVTLALKWVVNEMEKRYQIFAKVGARNIAGFNSRSKKKPEKTAQPELPLDEGEGFAVEMDQEVSVPRDEEIEIPEKLSYIVVIIDELADLMLMAKNDVENSIARITQMARAAGIHCIVATQRPSVDVITGVIKANIPARIAFQVAAKVDSRTILDAMGADKLLGKGDMLFLPPGTSNLRRAQGCLVTDDEINRIVEIVNNQAKPSYDKDMERQLEAPAPGNGGNGGGIDEDEDLIQQCIEVIRVEQKASVSLMQRRLRLGYTRAARIMDEIEDRGLVGPSRGAEPREILFDIEN